MNIAEAIGWKYEHQPGMRCREDKEDVMRIVEFPGGIPSQVNQDQIMQEYVDWIAAGGEKDAEARELMNSPLAISMLEEFTDILVSAGIPVPADVLTRIEDIVKSKL